MTTLYKPVLIETAEQAEALPGGSLVLDHESKWVYTDYFIAARPPLSGLQDDLDHGVHVVALVPIEAEEEVTARVQGFAGVFHVSRSTGSFPTPQRRLVTPWEEA